MPIVIPTVQLRRTQPNQYAQNGKLVRTPVEEYMRLEADQLRAFRGREQFCSPGQCRLVASSVATTPRNRWRYFSHTGPYTTKVRVRMRIARMQNTSASTPHCRFTLADGSGSTIGTFEAFYGAGATTGGDSTPDTWGFFEGEIPVSPDIDVQGLFDDRNYGRLVHALVWEEAAEPDTANGYLGYAPAFGSNIYDDERERLVTFVNAAWRRGGAQVLNFCHDLDATEAFSRSSATDINLIDETSTTISAATPGFTLDMTGKDLYQQGAVVPCVLAIYGSATAGSAAKVKIKDSGGSTLATVFLTTSAGWRTTTVNLPASSAKYDLHFSSNGTATGTLHAVSVFEYMT